MTKSILCCLVAAELFAGCRTPPEASFPSASRSAVDLAGLAPGWIIIAPSSSAANITVDPPNPRVQRMSEGAADAARRFLNTPSLGNPQLEAAVGTVQFALAPFAAAYGAVNARGQQLSPREMSDTQQQLTDAMRSNSMPDTLVQKVGEIARQKTRRLLVCFSSGSNAPPGAMPVSAVLEIAVEQLQLKVSKPGANQYFLSAGASARFVRNSDGKTLRQRSYHYESGPGFYFDWTRNGGLEGVADTAYQVLAEQIAQDFFEPPASAPILIGPQSGSRHLSLSGVGVELRTRGNISPRPQMLTAFHRGIGTKPRGLVALRRGSLMDDDSLRFAALQLDQTNAMEIHTGKTDDRLRAPKPGPETGNSTGTMSDTEWAMDGLVDDRNAVVQGISCLAAVPMGLWEQTFGIVGKRSRERTEQFASALRAVTTRDHFEGDLADAVARSLQSQVVDPIKRTDEPLRLSFAAADRPANPLADLPSTTAVEIQILSTQLQGRHRNSRSRALFVEIQATVYRTSDGQELYSCPIRYRSEVRHLKDWAASDAKLFRRELDTCTRLAAQALAKDLIARGFATPLTATNAPVRERLQ